MQGEMIRDYLHSGKCVYGTHLTNMNGPLTASSLTRQDLDFVFIDTEHIALDRVEVSWMCRFYAAHGISPTVRVAYPNRHLVSMAMDGGAQGVVVPYVESVEEVLEIVGVVKYRPLKGKQLQALLHNQHQLNSVTEAYLKKFNQHNYAMIGIESVPAVENLDALIHVPGLDAIFIGPHDLSVSMGMPEAYDHPDYVQALDTIIQKSSQAGLGVGMHLRPERVNPERLRNWKELGLNWILYSNDTQLLTQAVDKSLKTLRSIS